MKATSSWRDVIQTLREDNYQPRLLYPAKLSITIDGETKVFHDKTKFTHYSPSKENKRKKNKTKQTNKQKKTIQGRKPCPRQRKKVIFQQT